MSNINNPSVGRAQMCQFCGYRPRYYDERIGKLHPFCGKTCASKGAKAALCEHCQQRKKYGSQSFCGHECDAASKRRRLLTCALTGCTQRPTMFPIGTYWNYCSAAHEGSDTYSRNKFASPWKAVLLNSVVAGVVYETMDSAPHFTGAPKGYDSVWGIPGKDLNYDELVVYTDDAIRPTHIVICTSLCPTK